MPGLSAGATPGVPTAAELGHAELLVATVASLSRAGSPGHLLCRAVESRGAFLAPPVHNPYLPSENPRGEEEGAACLRLRLGGFCHEPGLGGKLQTENWLLLPSQCGGWQRVPLAGCRLGQAGCSLGQGDSFPGPHPKDRW